MLYNTESRRGLGKHKPMDNIMQWLRATSPKLPTEPLVDDLTAA